MLSDSLKVFITVADKKNFSKAAKALNLTQPAISFAVRFVPVEAKEAKGLKKYKGKIL